jgi:lipoyl(octanoyl) transferase
MDDQKHEPWRVILHAPAPGAWNMAVDEAILEQVAAGSSPPTLRLYAWAPACLSLGRAQPASDIDLAALERLGWSLVRRPTGGRAILHTDELTYAVIAHARNPVMLGGVMDSYRRIARVLLSALDRLALPAQADQKYEIPDGLRADGPVCFEVPSNYEITVSGKKLIGSAQARRKEGVLQHGTLPLSGDLARISQVLVHPDAQSQTLAAQRILQHATTVESVLGRKVTWIEAAQAMQDAFEETFSVPLQRMELSSAEEERAQILSEEKYNHPLWTVRI